MSDKNRFPGLGEVIAENLGNLEEASRLFDSILENMDTQDLRDELTRYQRSITELKMKMILEIIVDEEVPIDAKVYASPNDSIKSVVVSLQAREDAITSMLEQGWLKQ